LIRLDIETDNAVIPPLWRCGSRAKLALTAFFVTVLYSASPAAQQAAYDIEDVDVSYIYAAVMGTGTYKIDGRRITMLRMPFSWTHREMTDTDAGLHWQMPVTIGYDQVGGSDWFEELFPDDLVTLTVLPGAEYWVPLSPDWTLKPFINAGGTYDFVSEEVVALGVGGVSSVARFDLQRGWELRWGNKFSYAAEYQKRSESSAQFSMIEMGVDFRRSTGLVPFGYELDASVYYIYQHYDPRWEITDAPDRHSDLDNVHELGFSVGLKKPREILGITVDRVSFGYQKGGDIRGFTIGGEFPF